MLGKPVISNCGTPTENAPEFLDHHLKSIMQESWSLIKDTKGMGTSQNIEKNSSRFYLDDSRRGRLVSKHTR